MCNKNSIEMKRALAQLCWTAKREQTNTFLKGTRSCSWREVEQETQIEWHSAWRSCARTPRTRGGSNSRMTQRKPPPCAQSWSPTLCASQVCTHPSYNFAPLQMTLLSTHRTNCCAEKHVNTGRCRSMATENIWPQPLAGQTGSGRQGAKFSSV